MGKIKFLTVLAAVSCLFCANLAAQSSKSDTKSTSSENQNTNSSVYDDENKRFGNLYGNYTDQNNQSAENGEINETQIESPSSLWIFIKMIFFLAVVIGIIYAILWFMRRGNKKHNPDDPFLRAVSSVDLGQGKSVQIVTFMNKAFIVGVSENSVNLISEVDGNASEANKEMINSMNLYSDKKMNTRKPRSFNDILAIFMPNGKRDKKDLFEDSASSTEEFVRNQHERFTNNSEDSE